jgi:hypothetical protein
MTRTAESVKMSRAIQTDVMGDVGLPVWEMRFCLLLQLLLDFSLTPYSAGFNSSCDGPSGATEVLVDFSAYTDEA